MPQNRSLAHAVAQFGSALAFGNGKIRRPKIIDASPHGCNTAFFIAIFQFDQMRCLMTQFHVCLVFFWTHRKTVDPFFDGHCALSDGFLPWCLRSLWSDHVMHGR